MPFILVRMLWNLNVGKILKYNISSKSLRESPVIPFEPTDRRTDGETDITKLIAAFRNSANAPKMTPISSENIFHACGHVKMNPFYFQSWHCIWTESSPSVSPDKASHGSRLVLPPRIQTSQLSSADSTRSASLPAGETTEAWLWPLTSMYGRSSDDLNLLPQKRRHGAVLRHTDNSSFWKPTVARSSETRHLAQEHQNRNQCSSNMHKSHFCDVRHTRTVQFFIIDTFVSQHCERYLEGLHLSPIQSTKIII